MSLDEIKRIVDDLEKIKKMIGNPKYTDEEIKTELNQLIEVLTSFYYWEWHSKYSEEIKNAAEIMRSVESFGLEELRKKLNMEKEDFDEFIIKFAKGEGLRIDQKQGSIG